MNICFFNLREEFGSGATGGRKRAAHLLAEELRKRGHRVEFYSSSPSSRRFRVPLFSSFSPPASESERFRKFLKDYKIDVAVWHWAYHVLELSVKDLPCKLITMWHMDPAEAPAENCANRAVKRLKIRSRFLQRIFLSEPVSSLIRKFYSAYHNRLFLYALCHSDKFVLLSEKFFPEFPLEKKFPAKVCAIPNIATYEAQNASFDEKKKELLWLGRMDFNQKRPDLMLRIWQRLQDRFSDWSLCFVGDGPYLPELKALAEELGLKNVSFEGFQDPAPYYRSAPIFCMTSAYEGFPMVLLEAQAFACVPVAFESYSSVRDIIDDSVNGVLVPPFDLDIYAEKLAQLMSNPELRARLASAAQKSIAKFSAEAIGDKWEKLLLEVQAG